MNSPIDVLHLFPILNEKLISFLKALKPDDWNKQTVARKWVVKDVASHLLDGNFRRIAIHRDNYKIQPEWQIESYQDLLDFLNGLNADWVRATKRLSPEIIIDLLNKTNKEVYDLLSSLDPNAESVFPVNWAGQSVSQNWFDIAREYTERWLHQQQIRHALNNDELLTDELYYPFLNIFMQALPYTYSNTMADDDTGVLVRITGNGGGAWRLEKSTNDWKLVKTLKQPPLTEVILNGDAAWKLFSKSIRPEHLNGKVEIKGDRKLGEKALDMISVMA